MFKSGTAWKFSNPMRFRSIFKFFSTENMLSGLSIKEKCKYMKTFEKNEQCLPNSWIIVRLDGKGFSRFTEIHGFEKPNDLRALELMNRAAAKVMEEFKDICLAFGESDEYSFIFKKDTRIFDRCRHSISTVVGSVFTTAYIYYWKDYFGYVRLLEPPGFDSRVVVYPSDTNLRDYLCWRQADVHINNLYNTVFWTLVKKGNFSRREAQEVLKGTVSSQKNEILFKDYGINYNNEPIMFRKGTTLIRKLVSNEKDDTTRHYILQLNCDIIGDAFWKENYEILGLKSLQVFHKPEGMTAYKVNNYLNLCEGPDSIKIYS